MTPQKGPPPKELPPHEGWVELTRPAARFILSARLEGIAIELNRATGCAWAPQWAAIIATAPVPERLKMAALKRAAYDAETKTRLAVLIACTEPEDRVAIVKEIGEECGQVLVCSCGMKFYVASDWRSHVEICPKRTVR
jgi:hypothetical protein